MRHYSIREQTARHNGRDAGDPPRWIVVRQNEIDGPPIPMDGKSHATAEEAAAEAARLNTAASIEKGV